MRIGFLVHNQKRVTNASYRVFGPAAALKRAGHEVEVVTVRPDLGVDLERLRRCDVVHVYRLTNKETIGYLDDLRSRGIAITWDNDDDIRLLPPVARRHARIPALQAEGDFRNQPKVFRRTDLVTTTSDTLAERFAAVGAQNVARIPNYLQPEQVGGSAVPHEGIVIGWVAALEHYADAEQLALTETMACILDRHRAARVVTVGVKLDLKSDRYEHIVTVPLNHLRDTIRRFDVGIAPICDLPFNHARSDVKIKEYAGAGVPWVASARGPYAGYGAREGGLVVEDDGWEDALDEIVGSRLKRFRLRRRAAAWGKSQSIDLHVDEWVEAFEQAIAIAQERRTGKGVGRAAPSGRA